MAIADIVRIAERVLESIGHQSPEGFSDYFADELAKQLGGSRVYFRSGMTTEERRQRDKRIRSEFNGRNIKQICERYGVKRSRLYQILNEK